MRLSAPMRVSCVFSAEDAREHVAVRLCGGANTAANVNKRVKTVCDLRQPTATKAFCRRDRAACARCCHCSIRRTLVFESGGLPVDGNHFWAEVDRALSPVCGSLVRLFVRRLCLFIPTPAMSG